MATSIAAKCCLVTGGTKGIGRAIVETFAEENARVFTCARDSEVLESSLVLWKGRGYDVQGCVCDISSADSRSEMMQKVSERFAGKLNVLVNCAGTAIKKRAMDFNDADYDTLMETNLRSGYELCRMCHPLLKSSSPSSVVFIGSIAGGARVISSGCVYAMTKAAMSQLTKSLACEWAEDGIRVNTVAPGYITTPLLKTVHNESSMNEMKKETPMRRLGMPVEIANTVVFFAGDGASFVTGQTLFVDGGFSVRGLGY